MTTQNHSIAGSGYGSPYTDALVIGNCGWTLGQPVTYFLGDATTAGDLPLSSDLASNNYDGVVDGWSAAETAAFQTILANYAAVCGLTFAQAATAQSANIVEWQVSDSFFDSPTTYGESELADGDNGHNSNPDQVWAYYNFQQTSSWSQIQQGGDGFFTFIHEFGHQMGLDHPYGGQTSFPGVTGYGSTGTYGQNQVPYTVMTYNYFYDGVAQPSSLAFGEMGGLGAFDIAALQAMYGVNNQRATGDDTYVMPTANQAGTFWTCIWDAGGIDTIDDSASTIASIIDLRDAPLTGPNAGGYISANVGIVGGFTIAHGAVIENAIGGTVADKMIGNAVGNLLRGENGADTMIGDAGADSLVGGSGADALYGDASPAGQSGVGMGSGFFSKPAGYGNGDLAHAADVTNLFSLAANANILNATTIPHVTVNAYEDGNVDYYKLEILAGTTLTLDIDTTSSASDYFLRIYDANYHVLATNDDSPISSGAGGSTNAHDPFLTYTIEASGTYVIAVSNRGSSMAGGRYDLQISAQGSDPIGSGNGADTLDGGVGNDTMDGGLGADSMIGGVGNDIYYVDNVGDRVIEGVNEGTDFVHTTLASYTLGANVERLIFDNSLAHTGKGNGLSNAINGNSGNDKFLIDAGGNDTFSGGSGEDTFDGRSSATGFVLRLDSQGSNAGAVAGETFASVEKFFGSDTAADAMTTGAARAKFFGYGGNDTLTGGSSIDALSGGAGNDSLVGNAGQDALDGGIGNDTMTGGTGKDTFTFVDAAFGKDVITDFEDGVDRLKVFSAVADSFTDFTVLGNGSHHVVLTLVGATANTITLDNAAHNITVSAADFLFY